MDRGVYRVGMSATGWVGRFLVVVALVAQLVGCQLVDQVLHKEEANPDETVTLRMGITPYVSNSIVQIGVDEGYFAAQGLDLELVTMRNLPDMLALMATGELDASTPAINPALINAVAGGSKMRIVLPLTVYQDRECTTAAFLARTEDVESGKYRDLADWRGARVMVASAGTQGTYGYFLNKALAMGGLTLDDLVIHKSDVSVHEEALRSGQVDIVVEIEPWVTRATAAGDISVLMPIEPLVDGLQSSAIVFGEKLMGQAEVAERFAIAYMRAVRQYAEGPTPRNVEILSEFTQLEPELVVRMCWSYTPSDGSLNVASLDDFQHWLFEQGLIDRVLERDEFVDTRFLDQAMRQLDERK